MKKCKKCSKFYNFQFLEADSDQMPSAYLGKYSVVPVADVADHEDLLLLHNVLELPRRVHLDDPLARLLLHPLHHPPGLPGPAVVNCLALPDK